MNEEVFRCPEGIEGRVDKILADAYSGVSRTFIKRAIVEGRVVHMNGTQLDPKTRIVSGEELRINFERSVPTELVPYNYPLKIIFEDESIIVVDKEAGMVIHPGDGTGSDTLVHVLLNHLGTDYCPVGAPDRPGIVHRLDKETSGVMVVAKTEQAYHHLVEQFSTRTTEKKYRCIVSSVLKEDSGEFKGPIARHPKIRVKMTVVEHGKPALTTWRMIERFNPQYTLVECKIHTGRTHQIRVHFSDFGNPLAGDKTYGYRVKNSMGINFPRVMLHAEKLEFIHPMSEKTLSFEAEIPDDFIQVMSLLRK